MNNYLRSLWDLIVEEICRLIVLLNYFIDHLSYLLPDWGINIHNGKFYGLNVYFTILKPSFRISFNVSITVLRSYSFSSLLSS